MREQRHAATKMQAVQRGRRSRRQAAAAPAPANKGAAPWERKKKPKPWEKKKGAAVEVTDVPRAPDAATVAAADAAPVTTDQSGAAPWKRDKKPKPWEKKKADAVHEARSFRPPVAQRWPLLFRTPRVTAMQISQPGEFCG